MIALPSQDGLLVRPVSQLTLRPIEWLWPGRLALGKLAILDGDPGLGKSLAMLDLCARLTTGQSFPDDQPISVMSNALILNGEDADEDTIRPRLQALGADLDRVFVLHRAGNDCDEPLRFPGHLSLLDEALTRTRARLVVIDPIMAFLDNRIMSGSDQSIRRLMYPLAQLAARHRSAIVLVRHLNKTRGGRSIYRGGGSIGFVGACRSAWLIAPDPNDNSHRVLAQIKNNLAPPQPSLAYTVETSPSGTARLVWLGTSDWNADNLLHGAMPVAELSPRQRAREWLEDILMEGPRTSREIWASAHQQELAERTINRAKTDLEIRSVQVWIEGQRLSYWLLPGQRLPASVSPEAKPIDLDEWLEPLRQRFPPATPLDEM